MFLIKSIIAQLCLLPAVTNLLCRLQGKIIGQEVRGKLVNKNQRVSKAGRKLQCLDHLHFGVDFQISPFTDLIFPAFTGLTQSLTEITAVDHAGCEANLRS